MKRQLSGMIGEKADLVEETRSLSQDPALLFQFRLSLPELFPASIEIDQTAFVLFQLLLQLIVSVLCTRPDRREWWTGVERRDTEGRLECGDLGLEKTESTRGFCQAAKAWCERSLESRDGWVKLEVSVQCDNDAELTSLN